MVSDVAWWETANAFYQNVCVVFVILWALGAVLVAFAFLANYFIKKSNTKKLGDNAKANEVQK